jgi:hypothetical protein
VQDDGGLWFVHGAARIHGPWPTGAPVVSVPSRMTQACADRQEDTSRLSHPVRSVALSLLTGYHGLDRR